MREFARASLKASLNGSHGPVEDPESLQRAAIEHMQASPDFDRRLRTLYGAKTSRMTVNLVRFDRCPDQ
jgi:hypothetical protein